MTLTTKTLSILTVLMVITTAVLSVLTFRSTTPGAMPHPGFHLQPIYAGNAAAYRLSGEQHLAAAPRFRVDIPRGDYQAFRAHLENTIAARNWVETQNSLLTHRQLIVPDYDVNRIREIAAAPDRWGRHPDRQLQQHAPIPELRDLMVVQLDINTDHPAETLLFAAFFTGFLATCGLFATLVSWGDDLNKAHRQRQAEATT